MSTSYLYCLFIFFFSFFHLPLFFFFFFFNDTATTEIYTLSLHDALPIYHARRPDREPGDPAGQDGAQGRSEEHTSELQSRPHLVCRLLLEKKKKKIKKKKKKNRKLKMKLINNIKHK